MTPKRGWITKTTYSAFRGCPKAAYMDSDAELRLLKSPQDWYSKFLEDAGKQAGGIARGCFPGGVAVAEWGDCSRATEATARLLEDPAVTHLFEPTFTFEGIEVRVDVLERLGDGTYHLIEVKAANLSHDEKGRKNTEYVHDAAIQAYVLDGAGLEVSRISLMHFDPEWRSPTPIGQYDPADTLMIEDYTAEARKFIAEKLPAELAAFRAVLAAGSPPAVRLKNSCHKCEYWAEVCSLDAPDYPICELGGTSRKLLGALHDAGYDDIESIDEAFYESLTEEAHGRNPKHDTIRACVLSGEPFFSSDLSALLDEAVRFPAYWMDFETCGAALPLFQAMGTWQKITFQWSVHRMPRPDATDDEIGHEEFLAQGTRDPRRDFAETLIAAIGIEGSVVVYNESFEKTLIKELARDFPDLSDALLAINERVVDLLPIVKGNAYHPAFHGSFSIKYVLPALCDGMSYEGLDVSDGTAAMQAYEKLIDPSVDESEKALTREALLKYCGQDTFAMIEIFRALRRRGESAE